MRVKSDMFPSADEFVSPMFTEDCEVFNLMCFLSFKVGDITRTRRPPPILQDPAQTVFCKVGGLSDCRCINLGQLE